MDDPTTASPRALTRQELYELVWTEPLSKLAPRYALSGPGLKKICTRHKIPTPGRGYWQRLRHGYKVRRKKLPKLYSDDPNPAITLEPSKRRSTKIEPREEGPVADQKRFEALPENKIEVKGHLRGSHPLIRQTRQAWKEQSQEGYWRQNHKTKALDIAVSKGTERRALLIMNALLKALEKRGIEAAIAEERKNPTVVLVHGQKVKIRLEERRKRIQVKRKFVYPGSDEYRNELEWTGRLTLLIDSFLDIPRKTWTDGKRQRVENCLNDFVVALVIEATARRAWRKKLEENERRREALRREREAESRRRQIEGERAQELRRQVDTWLYKKRIEKYLEHCEGISKDHRPSGPGLPTQDWLRWIRKYSTRMNSPAAQID